MIISNICDSNMWLGGHIWPTKQSNTARKWTSSSSFHYNADHVWWQRKGHSSSECKMKSKAQHFEFLHQRIDSRVSLLASSQSNLHLCQIQMLELQEHKSVHVKTLSAGFQELTNSENTCAVFKLHSERWKCGCFPWEARIWSEHNFLET